MNVSKSLIRNLLDNVDREQARANSFLNYHVRGLNYLNVLRTPQLTAKFYMVDEKRALVPVGPYGSLVCPHDHGYNFHSFVVQGTVKNLNFLETKNVGPSYVEFGYNSRLKSFRIVGKTRLNPTETIYGRGESYYLKHDRVHTITISDDAVIFLLQYSDEVKDETRFFATDDRPPNLAGLYIKPESNDIDRMIQQVYKAAEWCFED